MNKPKLSTFISPVALAGFVHLEKPNTRFKPDGEWSIDLIMEPEAAEKFKAELTAKAVAAQKQIISEAEPKKQKALASYNLFVPCKADTDKDGNETGNTVFPFKCPAGGTDAQTGEKWSRDIDVRDAKKNPMKERKIGRGSKVRVAYSVFPFANATSKDIGISLRLKAVQVLDLIEYGTKAGDAFDEEEGYTAGNEAQEPVAAGSADF